MCVIIWLTALICNSRAISNYFVEKNIEKKRFLYVGFSLLVLNEKTLSKVKLLQKAYWCHIFSKN